MAVDFRSSTIMAAQLKNIVKSSPMLTRMVVPLYRIKSFALARIPVNGEIPLLSERTHLDVFDFASLAEYTAWRKANEERLTKWEAEDKTSLPRDSFAFRIPGFCALCSAAVDFIATYEYGTADPSGEVRPNWREHLICPRCNLRNRVRAALHFAIQQCDMTPDKKVYLTEQFGSCYRWMRGHLKDVAGSEYLGPSKVSGSKVFGINHQDLHALSHASASFNIVLSFDVLEHVPHYLPAFAEIFRVLAPGGRLVMTVPFIADQYDTVVRAAVRSDGKIEHFLPIEVHGNPTDPINGALCFRNFGWDVLDRLRETGFEEAKVHVYHNRELGYMGGPQTLISATKARESST